MRISDWSSDVCSSDLPPSLAGLGAEGGMLGERIGRRPRADRALVARQHGELVAVERELHELQVGSTGLQGAGQLRIEVAVLLIAQQKAAFVVEPDEAIGHALDRFDQQRTRACRLPLAVEEPALDGLTLRRVPWRQGDGPDAASSRGAGA